MNNHFSILHISDLHKGENNDFDHLFASMCNDADSYDREMPRPEIIVISGDLAQKVMMRKKSYGSNMTKSNHS